MRKILFVIVLCLLSFSYKIQATEGVYYAPYVSAPPMMDGEGTDSCWSLASWAPIENVWIGASVSASDYSGRFKAVWTPERVYVLVEITDDSLSCQKVLDINNIYNYDCIEIFVDENHSRGIYTGTYQAFAYHIDTAGHVGYARGDYGWERLDDHIITRFKKVGDHLYNWEFGVKIFNDTYDPSRVNTPDSLVAGKLMGWSIAYNDNDGGTVRQNMFGSKYIAGNDKNISYYNSSAFGDIYLVNDTSSVDTVAPPSLIKEVKGNASAIGVLVIQNEGRIRISCKTLDNGAYNLCLFNTSGTLMLQKEILKTQQSDDEILNIKNFHSGMYFLTVQGRGKTYATRFVYVGK
jgi:hypothetical protein